MTENKFIRENKKFSKIQGIGFGFKGIIYCIKKDKNVRHKWIIAIIVIIISMLTNISQVNWFIVLLICGIMISLEMTNSAFEKFLDLMYPEYNKEIGEIKDITAGVVQTMSYVAIIIGFTIFIIK
ncbi:MAG: diacylglycerol kinase [Candidatus Pacebacteria bacterium]|nr:diacylglycerol kinase [Candidatus Paceibacterota bacterium]